MGYSKKTNRMDIFVEESSKKIVVQQKWCYNWRTSVGTTQWTYPQKKNFHSQVDRLIWGKWGGSFEVKVRGNSNFAKQYKNSSFKIYFDVKWVLSGEHWKVKAEKIKPGNQKTSFVKWNDREIQLDTEDTLLRKITHSYKTSFQYPAVHEFGHAIGNSSFSKKGMHGDEYNTSSAFYLDTFSIMNIGNELRKRHIDYLLSELNTIIPNTDFYV